MRQRRLRRVPLALAVGMLAVLVGAESDGDIHQALKNLLGASQFECVQLIEIETGHLVLMVDIGKKTGFFVVDSGATHTIVAREKLDELGLTKPAELDADATTIDGEQPVDGRLVLRDVRFGSISRKELEALVIPLGALQGDIERRYSRPLHGVIGQDFLRE